ncbi:MAG: esterase/lipase family protein [Phycisphaerales bacterium]
MFDALLQCFAVPAANPAFVISRADALRDLARMAVQPVPLQRPVVVLSGYRSPAIPARRLERALRRATGTSATLSVAYPMAGEIESAVGIVLDRVHAAFGDSEDGLTAPVDVVAISMGGLVARAAAAGPGVFGPGSVVRKRRLNVRRLFTLASPHRGAVLAEVTAPDRAANDMLPGSAFLARLDAALTEAKYELMCYTRLRDGFVGARRTAPPGREPMWTSGLLWGSHFTVSDDPRIVADVCRRLRDEPPVAKEDGAPPRD